MPSSNSSNDEKKYICSECQAAFSKPSSLKQHCLAKNHNALQCLQCNHIFLSKQALAQHTKAKHKKQDKKAQIPKKKLKEVEKSPEKIKKEIDNLEKKREILKKEIDDLEDYINVIDDNLVEKEESKLVSEILQDEKENKNLESDIGWYRKLNLISNPFPTKNGLLDIDELYYDSIVLRTNIISKYMDIIETSPMDLINKSFIIYGEFGCGKTTLFDYLNYFLPKKDILPINLILDAEPSLIKLRESFWDALFNELAIIIEDDDFFPRDAFFKKDRNSILELFNHILKTTNFKYFILFIDGLHKSEDNREIPLHFLNQFQNSFEFFLKKGIKIGIFVSGSNDWKSNTKYASILMGSFYNMDKIPELTSSQAYDMLQMRLESFSQNPSLDLNFFSKNDIDYLVNSIKKRSTTEVSFRIFINEFLNSGYIIHDKIEFKINIEQDIYQTISKEMQKNSLLVEFLVEFKTTFDDHPHTFEKVSLILSNLYENRFYSTNNEFVKKFQLYFDLLQKNGMIKKIFHDKKNDVIYLLENSIFSTFNIIENNVRYYPKYYLYLYYSIDQLKINEKKQHIEFLNTLTRYQTESIQYKDEIEHLKQIYIQEYTPFLEILEDSMNSNIVQVEKKIIGKMDSLIAPFLKFIYSISNELESFGSIEELYQIFRFTWLDNDELTLFLNERNKNLTKVITSKIEKGKFFASFKEAIERMIRKIGKHLTYNTVINIGSKKLTDFDKRELNRSRAFYKVPQYKKAIEKYSDLLEIRIRNFIYSILKLKYGKRWQDLIPGTLKDEITLNKNRDLVHFGKYLTNDNILSYLGRGQYTPLILEKYLWNLCFKHLFGDMNKDLIIELQTISSMANLQKHLREEENLKEISYQIPQNLEKVKLMVEHINYSFQILFLPQNIYFNESTNQLYFSFAKLTDQEKLEPIEIIPKDIKKILETLKIINNYDGFREKYINLANFSDLHKKFGLEYRKIIGIMGYLLKLGKINIKDYFGSCFYFNFNE